MKTLMPFKLGLAAALLIATAAIAAPATEQLTPSAQNEHMGATTGLGESHRFPTAAAATNHCPGDTIVWLHGSNLSYYLPDTAKYGKGVGSYACKAEADDAGFKSASQ